ncbi:MAG: hypothetical protein JW732_06735 [Dehalococcoidia bacterium]|nr:hypothetical protein [Dehalococcoidia bacterium]
MRWRPFISIFAFGIAALILAIIAWTSGETALNAYALGVLAVGLGVNSLIISLNTAKRTNSIEAALTRIESLQQEIKKAQEEQPGSNRPILATLEGLTQYYLDYMAKQKAKDENEKS